MTLEEIEIPTLLAHCRWIYYHRKHGLVLDKEDMMKHMKTQDGKAILCVLLGDPTNNDEHTKAAKALYKLATTSKEEEEANEILI